MRLTKLRRLAVLSITVPALAAGGTAIAGASSAAPATAGPTTQQAATAAARTAAAALPAGCSRAEKMRFQERTDIPGHKGKLIGHVSLYTGYSGSGPAYCVITWRNGVARGVRGRTTAYVRFTQDGQVWRTVGTAKNKVRSRAATGLEPKVPYTWWGRLAYKGEWYTARKKTF